MDEAAPLDGAVLDVADAEDYGSMEEEDAITAMMMINGCNSLHETFQQAVV